jgi:hypothetical protein
MILFGSESVSLSCKHCLLYVLRQERRPYFYINSLAGPGILFPLNSNPDEREANSVDKRLTPYRNRLVLLNIHLNRATAISLPPCFEGGRLLVLKTKSFASAAPGAPGNTRRAK